MNVSFYPQVPHLHEYNVPGMSMRYALSSYFAAMLLMAMAPLLSKAEEAEPFGFKEDRLGMSLVAFKEKHLSPGAWVDEVSNITSSLDYQRPPRSKGKWKWKPDMVCEELSKEAVIEQCKYQTTVAGNEGAVPVALFVGGKLAIIRVRIEAPVKLVQDALTAKFGAPTLIPVSGDANTSLSAVRWNNDVSVVEFQGHYCGSGSHDFRQGWKKDVTDVLQGRFCDNSDGADSRFAVIWYVHKSLSSLAMTRWQDASEKARKAVRSDV